MSMNEYGCSDCYARLQDGRLIIGNSCLERVWDMQGDIPAIVSLNNKKTGREWLTNDSKETRDWLTAPEQKYAFYKKAFTKGGLQNASLETDTDDDFGIGEKHLRASVKLEYPDYILRWVHLVYPQRAILRSYIEVTVKNKQPASQQIQERSVYGENFYDAEPEDDYLDAFPISPIHCKWKSIAFTDRTDDYDNLVAEEHGIMARREGRYIQGNLLFVTDPLTGEGLTFVKEGPTPLAYIGNARSDFYLKGKNVYTTGWGFDETEFQKGKTFSSYYSTVMLWEEKEMDAQDTLHQFHEAVHVFVPKKDAFVMTNTWGDQSADGKLGEKFLFEELKRAEEVGITFYQIDDGWQNGTTANSVNPGGIWGMGYYKAQPDFWTVNPKRFPNGLEPVVEEAKKRGIRLGLWFSPDSGEEFENWERDAGTLIQLHEKYGISAFKMDGIIIEGKKGEENLTRLMQRVVVETKGEVFFNMDTTASTRCGYFGRVQYGSLFIENRFTGNFGQYPNYYPHHTLRNLWMLSQYYPASRLQMEFLNPKKNVSLYGEDVLSPAVSGVEYNFAVTMFANPLAWMETTGLEQEEADILHGVIPNYLKIQSDILSGQTIPIGEEPDGTSWTGFLSKKTEETGFLQIIREYNHTPEHIYQIPKLAGKNLKLTALFGNGKSGHVMVDSCGFVRFSLEETHQYAVYEYQVISDQQNKRSRTC